MKKSGSITTILFAALIVLGIPSAAAQLQESVKRQSETIEKANAKAKKGGNAIAQVRTQNQPMRLICKTSDPRARGGRMEVPVTADVVKQTINGDPATITDSAMSWAFTSGGTVFRHGLNRSSGMITITAHPEGRKNYIFSSGKCSPV